MSNTFVIRFWGDGALFCIPHFRADPYSYPVSTPSAVKGMLKSIYWKPEFEWEILRIHVMAPIRYESKRFRAVKISSRTTGDADRTLQWNTVLRQVEYFVECRILSNPYRADRNYDPEALRRLRKGQQYTQPCFGRNEFPAAWELWEGDIPKAQPIDLEIGSMLFDLVPVNMSKDQWFPVFFQARLEKGVLEIPQDLYAKHRDTLFRARHASHKGSRRAA